MIGSKKEFDELVKLVQDRNCKTDLEVQNVLDEYFGNIIWSVLKDEYLKLTDTQRDVLVTKLLKGQKRKRGMGSS